MTNLTDARILYKLWAQIFDPSAGSFEQLSANVQEGWLRIAASARMLSSEQDPEASPLPGFPYLATWHRSFNWADVKAPSRPQLMFTMEPGWSYVIEFQSDCIPRMTRILRPPEYTKRIPGFIYDSPPIY